MQFVTPEVHLLAQTAVNQCGLDNLLHDIGADAWQSDANSDAELLAEVAGRLCYRSFAPGLNPNVTKVREGNANYIKNIIAQKHGSVLEHGTASFAFVNVSRVATHEIVRHRIAGYSQESLRFIRLDKLAVYFPEIGFGEATMAALYDSYDENRRNELQNQGLDREMFARTKALWLRDTFRKAFEEAERLQQEIGAFLALDKSTSFPVKKKITSAMRRLAPDGLATAIVMSANHRTWRDCIERRTSRHAEEEIRLVFAKVYERLSSDHPAIYADANEVAVDGIPEITFSHSRV
jgi:thymidylate synthase (FAD)